MYLININKFTFTARLNKDYWTTKPAERIVMLSS